MLQISPPEPIPFPSSQTDRKTSPHFPSQRAGQAAGQLSDRNDDGSVAVPLFSFILGFNLWEKLFLF